ncbi:MAG: VanZ family protein [Lachnospiraceae bacterium]|nr:VanZ family protein [Lachnospiraceae bacterium]
MSQYLIPIEYAFFVFPIIAFLFTFPYMFVQYFKYGSMVFLKTLIVYTFILYCINIFFLVILPLPPISEVVHNTSEKLQLVPFHFLDVFRDETCLNIHDKSTWIPAMKQDCFYVPVLNVLMLVPMGIYLRYYFKRNFIETFLICLSVSAFFELTQYSALYGIYPRPYRLCDVDDLIQNTFGGMVGFICTPLFTWILPDRDTLDTIAYEKAIRISFFRRLCAMIVDTASVTCIAFLTDCMILRPLYRTTISGSYGLTVIIWILIIYYVLVPVITKGYTVGKRMFKMRLVTKNGDTPKPYQYLIRYGLLYLQLLGIPYILYNAYLIKDKCTGNTRIALYAIVIAAGSIIIILLLETMIKILGINSEYLYGIISGTRNQNIRQTTKTGS